MILANGSSLSWDAKFFRSLQSMSLVSVANNSKISWTTRLSTSECIFWFHSGISMLFQKYAKVSAPLGLRNPRIIMNKAVQFSVLKASWSLKFSSKTRHQVSPRFRRKIYCKAVFWKFWCFFIIARNWLLILIFVFNVFCVDPSAKLHDDDDMQKLETEPCSLIGDEFFFINDVSEYKFWAKILLVEQIYERLLFNVCAIKYAKEILNHRDHESYNILQNSSTSRDIMIYNCFYLCRSKTSIMLQTSKSSLFFGNLCQ